jgi:hypothetical protein
MWDEPVHELSDVCRTAPDSPLPSAGHRQSLSVTVSALNIPVEPTGLFVHLPHPVPDNTLSWELSIRHCQPQPAVDSADVHLFSSPLSACRPSRIASYCRGVSGILSGNGGALLACIAGRYLRTIQECPGSFYLADRRNY